jgi:hypothetical protein
MMIVLLSVIGKRFLAQLAPRPREIKRMFQQMLLRDVIVDLAEMLIHKQQIATSLRLELRLGKQIFTD